MPISASAAVQGLRAEHQRLRRANLLLRVWATLRRECQRQMDRAATQAVAAYRTRRV